MLNLTPHAITIIRADGTSETFQPSGQIARVATTEVVVGEVKGMPVVARSLGQAEGMPEEGTLCLVSAMVLSAVPGRKGVYAPDSGPTAVRKDGQVVAVTRLVAA